ncbi:g4989 [Coccomyxa viridis]|uniref:G4989 protein n=1 Tax=Coccomyxa viridis TaxID=1274662 RepID=A0ABP1FWN2_9CHLO
MVMSTDHDSESNTVGRSGSDRRHPRTLDALYEGAYSTKLTLRGVPEGVDFSACPFPCTHNEEQTEEWQIDVPWPEDDGAPWELLKWFAEVVQSITALDKRPAQKQKLHMALPPALSKEARAYWHKLVEGFREPIPMTAISQGVGDERHLQILPVLGREGAAQKKGRPKAVSEQAKELWTWCQEEGGANWSYSQGEIEDLLQSKQPLPPQLQQVMEARSIGLQLFESIDKGQEAEAIRLIDEESRSAYIRDANKHGYTIHHAVFQDLQHVVARLAIMPGVLHQRDSHRQSAYQLARKLKRQDVLEIISWALS